MLVSFDGNKTPKRKEALFRWERQNDVRLGGLHFRKGTRGFHGSWTHVGRRWPEKAWDPYYVDRLGASQFALCPDGDFVWTYRFFKAAAAGAIPIIENMCSLFRGFHFALMTDPFDDLEWSADAAESNFERVKQMLTLPIDVLAKEVLDLGNGVD